MCNPTDTPGAFTPAGSAIVTRSYSVLGMTCGHCVASVTEEVQEVPGVGEVTVELVVDGASTLTVTSDQPLADEVVQAAVAEAGYRLA
jgi:copper chaperone